MANNIISDARDMARRAVGHVDALPEDHHGPTRAKRADQARLALVGPYMHGDVQECHPHIHLREESCDVMSKLLLFLAP